MKYILLLALLIPAISWSAMTKVQDMMRLEEATNILTNPAFESPVADQGWTNPGAAVGVVETSVVIQGKQSLKFSPTIGQTVNLSQHSSLYATSFADGVQGLAMIWLKSSMALTVCTIQNGATSSTNCVITQTDSKWKLYKLPMILGSGNNGISITGTSVGGSNTVYADAAFVGAVDLKADAPQIATQSSYLINVSSFTATATITGALTSSSGSSVYSYNSGTGLYTMLKDGAIVANYKNEAGGAAAVSANIIVNGSPVNTDVSAAVTNDTTSVGYTAKLVSGTTFFFRVGTNAAINHIISVTATETVNTSTYSSTNADTDWAACNFSTLAWQGLGTVSNFLSCKRQGSDLLIRGLFVPGTTTATEARVPLPLWDGVQLTSTGSAGTSFGRIVRGIAGASQGKDFMAVGAVSVFNYFNIGTVEYALTPNPFVPQNGNAVLISGETVSIDARIPISGWTNSNIIIGQFAEVPTTRGSNGADIQSVHFIPTCTTGTCTTSSLIGNKITSVSWVALGTYEANGIDGTKYNCTGAGFSTGSNSVPFFHDKVSSSSTKARVDTYSGGAGVNVGQATLICIGIP